MRSFILILVLIGVDNLYAQTDGITYQAVIIDPIAQEIPGADVSGNILPNKQLAVRFTITDEVNGLEYQEVQTTSTDAYGMIHLIIGQGQAELGVFTEIVWDGNPKNLNVAINLDEGFVDLGEQALMFTPHAYHRDIIASGNLSVEGAVELSGNLELDGTMRLNNTLDVANGSATNLTGTLNVDGATDINNTLNVDGVTIFNDALSVTNGSATDLTGTLSVDNATDLNSTLTVDGATTVDNVLTVTGSTNLTTLSLGDDLTVAGITNLNNSLSVNNGTFTNLTGTLNVDEATDLNNTLTVDGMTTLNNSLDVTNGSATNLTGTLNVDEATDLNNTLTVDGATTLNNSLDVTNGSATNLTGTLNVDEATSLNNILTVAGATVLNSTFQVTNASAANLSGTLTVAGATVIDDDLQVSGTTSLDTLNVKSLGVTSDLATFVSTFENTNNGGGNGIKIKLGKEKTVIVPTVQIPGLPSAPQISQIKNLIRCDYSGPKITILGDIVLEGVTADIEMIGGLAVSIGNLLTSQINATLGLPINLPEIKTPRIRLPRLRTPSIDLGLIDIPSLTVTNGFTLLAPTVLLPTFEVMPELPTITLEKFGIPAIDINDPDFWGIPNFCLDDSGSPLNNTNEFVQFTDNADVKMGSIRAVSKGDWETEYLNPVFLFKLKGALTSAVDKKHARYHFKSEVSAAIKDYNAIGVEYSSGNGDYAEWLERIDHNEAISTGDIVAVKGGKITKNLEGAEQVMAVSHRPIVLGNVPEDGKGRLGNNIAFMGQIPVKIMGSVVAGDYIVAKGNITGYGIAIKPEDMKLEDFKLAVGRSWDTNLNSGPKMINTVIGVHNGDYINILKRYEQKFKQSEARLESVESKVEALTDLITNKVKSLNDTF